MQTFLPNYDYIYFIDLYKKIFFYFPLYFVHFLHKLIINKLTY